MNSIYCKLNMREITNDKPALATRLGGGEFLTRHLKYAYFLTQNQLVLTKRSNSALHQQNYSQFDFYWFDIDRTVSHQSCSLACSL